MSLGVNDRAGGRLSESNYMSRRSFVPPVVQVYDAFPHQRVLQHDSEKYHATFSGLNSAFIHGT